MKKFLTFLSAAALSTTMFAQSSVTFNVDMRSSPVGQGETVTVAGSFQSAVAGQTQPNWTQGINLMTDPDGDCVYSITLMVADGSYEYKFARNAGATNNWEGQANRTLTVAGAAQTLPTFCYGLVAAGACAGTNACTIAGVPDTVTTTIKIDFSRAFAIFGQPHNGVITIAGDFQMAAGGAGNWSPGAIIMTPDPAAPANTIYQTPAMRLPEGTYAFKTLFGETWGFDENPIGACVASNNRKLVVPGTLHGLSNGGTYTYAPVCFAACDVCRPLGQPRQVKFVLDATNEAPGASYFIDGTFNFPSFSGNHIAMTETAPGSQIFEKTLTLYSDDYFYRYYTAATGSGAAAGEETNADFVPACLFGTTTGALGDFRRTCTITEGAGTFVVNNTYKACPTVATKNTQSAAAYFLVSPNPFKGTTTINFANNTNGKFSITVSDLAGKTLKTVSGLSGNTATIDGTTLSAGVYFATLQTENGARYTQKLIVE
jgi:hypothetical protein